MIATKQISAAQEYPIPELLREWLRPRRRLRTTWVRPEQHGEIHALPNSGRHQGECRTSILL